MGRKVEIGDNHPYELNLLAYNFKGPILTVNQFKHLLRREGFRRIIDKIITVR